MSGAAPYHDYKPVWKKAGDISLGDYILYATPIFTKTTKNISVSQYLSGNWYSVANGTVWYQKNKTGSTKRGGMCQYKLPDLISVDERTAYLFGLYVAEGSAPLRNDRGTVYFSFHSKEKRLVKTVVDTVESVFGVKCSGVRTFPHTKSVRVEFYSKPLAMFMTNVFGKGARNKRIPEFIMSSDDNIRRSFLRGLFDGDGCKRFYTFGTVSRNLIEQVRLLCFALGLSMSIYYSKKSPCKTIVCGRLVKSGLSYYGQMPRGAFHSLYGHKKHKWHDKHLRYMNFIGFAVTSVNRFSYRGRVYDIQVSNGESFLTPSGVVHNCMITYSGEVWGGVPHADDLSRCKSDEDFLEKLQLAMLNMRDSVAPAGYYGIIIGDQRKKGAYFSYQAECIARMPKNELKAVLIKAQHNVMSNQKSYGHLGLPRIMHEYILLWQKPESAVMSSLLGTLSTLAHQSQRRLHGTWKSVVWQVLINLGGRASLQDLYKAVEEAAPPEKLASNAEHLRPKIRQTLYTYSDTFRAGDGDVWELAAAA